MNLLSAVLHVRDEPGGCLLLNTTCAAARGALHHVGEIRTSLGGGTHLSLPCFLHPVPCSFAHGGKSAQILGTESHGLLETCFIPLALGTSSNAAEVLVHGTGPLFAVLFDHFISVSMSTDSPGALAGSQKVSRRSTATCAPLCGLLYSCVAVLLPPSGPAKVASPADT